MSDRLLRGSAVSPLRVSPWAGSGRAVVVAFRAVVGARGVAGWGTGLGGGETAGGLPAAGGRWHGSPEPDGLRDRLRGAWRRYRSRQRIAELTPHLLKDIGVTYAEAETEANKPFWSP